MPYKFYYYVTNKKLTYFKTVTLTVCCRDTSEMALVIMFVYLCHLYYRYEQLFIIILAIVQLV